MPLDSPTICRPLSCLLPDDLMWACWQSIPSPERKIPRPFNRDQCIAEIEKSTEWPDHWVESLSKRFSPFEISREESAFWLYASAAFCKEGEYLYSRHPEDEAKIRASVVKKLRNDDHLLLLNDLQNLPAFVKRHLKCRYTLEPEWLAYLLCSLVEPKAIVALAAERSLRRCYKMMKYFRTWIMPYMTAEQLSQCHEVVRRNLDPSKVFDESAEVGQWYVIACFLRMAEDVLTMVETLKDDALRDYDNDYVLGHLYAVSLPSPELVRKHFNRFGFTLDCPTYRFDYYEFDMIKAWLAIFGLDGLSLVAERVLEFSREDYVQLLLSIDSPDVVPFVIRLMEDKDGSHYMTARKWLQSHADWAAPVLLARSKDGGKNGAAAKGLLGTIRTILNPDACPPEVVQEVSHMFASASDGLPELDESMAPAWLKNALKAETNIKKKVVLPPWLLDAGTLPPIVVDGRKTSVDLVRKILLALKQSDLESVHPLVAAFQENVPRTATESLALAIFELWEESDSPPKDKWAMHSLALFGGDLTVSKLAALVREWPGQSQHKKAVTGLECLQKIGSLTALMYISALAHKLKFPALKAKAQECMERIAANRGLSRDELEDRTVPDCELDENGHRIFDFGKRQFSFTLGQDLKPMLKYPDGALKSDLPKPNSSDDAEMSRAAIDQWKLVKIQVKDSAKFQASRLEQSMIAGRRWSIQDFKELLVQHPLMMHMVRSLVWGCYRQEKPELVFRVSDDGTFADVDDRECQLPLEGKIGIVHPISLSKEARDKWREVILEDYKLFPPFHQMNRAVFELSVAERTQETIVRYSQNEVPATKLISTLEKRGWFRGDVRDGGHYFEHVKHFCGADISAVVEYTGLDVGSGLVYADPQVMKLCYFMQGNAITEGTSSKSLVLKDVDPIVVSEVLADLNSVTE